MCHSGSSDYIVNEVWNSLGIRTKNDNYDCNLWIQTSKPTQTLCDHRERRREEESS